MSTMLKDAGKLHSGCEWCRKIIPGRNPSSAGIDAVEVLVLVKEMFVDIAYPLNQTLIEEDIALEDLAPFVAAGPYRSVLW